MQIIYVTNARIPTPKAHGLQIMENCHTFAALPNVKVTLFSARRTGSGTQNPFAYYGLAPTFLVKRLWSLDLLFFPFFKKIFFALQAASFTVVAFLSVIMRSWGESIIYTRDFYIAACLSFVKPVFYEVHSLPNKPTFLHRLSWKRSCGLIVISSGLRDDLIKYGVPASKILVARDGFNAAKFSPHISRKEARAFLAIPPEQQVVVYTGHLYEWKGANTLAEAAFKLLPDVHVYLVGGTENDVNNFRRQYQSDNLHIVGHRSPNEIPQWLAAADILVIPNSARERISSHYTSPLKLFEYLASGRPIIASDLPSIREVLTGNEAAFFTPDNSDDLVQRIIEVQRDPEVFLERARLAQSKVWEYSWDNRSRLIHDFILARQPNISLNE